MVQPALAAGLLILLAASTRLLGERPRRQDAIATLAIVAGIALVAIAAPAPSHEHAHGARLTVALSGLAALVAAPYVLEPAWARTRDADGRRRGRGLRDRRHHHCACRRRGEPGVWAEALAWGVATAAASGAGLLGEMSALQERPAIHVAPVVFTVQTVLPVALAPWLLHAVLRTWARSPRSLPRSCWCWPAEWALVRSPALLRLDSA